MSNVDKLREVYQSWHDTRGSCVADWLALVADDVVVKSLAGGAPGMEYSATRRGRGEVEAFLAGIQSDWEMVHFTPDEFVEDGDRVVMIGRHCAWRHRGTSKVAESSTVHYWRFRDGQAIEFYELFDTAVALAATQRIDISAEAGSIVDTLGIALYVCVGVLCGGGLLFVLWQEAKSQRVFGGYTLRVRLRMAGMVRKTAHRSEIRATLTFFLIGIVLPALIGFILKPVFLLVLICAMVAWWLHMTCPPAVIVLTSSGQRGANLFRDVVAAITPLRTTALLEKSVCRTASTSLTELNNLRTLRDEDWEEVVDALIDMVLIVVVDTRRASPAVVQETLRMIHPDRVGKALFVCDPDSFVGPAYVTAAEQAADNPDHEVVSPDQIRFTAPDEIGPLLRAAVRGDWVPRLSLERKPCGARTWGRAVYDSRWVIGVVVFLSGVTGLIYLVTGHIW